MAQNCAVAGSEYSRHPLRLSRKEAMTYRIDATLHPMESANLQAMPNLPSLEAEVSELRSPNHPMLPLGERRDRLIHSRSARLSKRSFDRTIRFNVPLALHRASFGATGTLVMRETSWVTRTFVTRRRRCRNVGRQQ